VRSDRLAATEPFPDAGSFADENDPGVDCVGSHESAASTARERIARRAATRLDASVRIVAGHPGDTASGAAPNHGALFSALADRERFPEVHRALEAGVFDPSESDRDAGFAFGLGRILDSIERLVAQRAGKPA
jgi:hypothetical protein